MQCFCVCIYIISIQFVKLNECTDATLGDFCDTKVIIQLIEILIHCVSVSTLVLLTISQHIKMQLFHLHSGHCTL